VVQIETWCFICTTSAPGVIIRAKSASELSKIGARKGIRPMKINKTVIRKDVILTPGNRPTLLQCSKDGVVLYGLPSRGVKR